MVTYQHHHEHQQEGNQPSPLQTPPRISFSSSEFLDDMEFISINPKKPPHNNNNNNNNNGEFEFFSSGKNVGGAQTDTMSSADELFYDGKLLPFWQKHPCFVSETKNEKIKPNKSTKEEEIVAVKTEEENKAVSRNTSHPSWYLDEDPSPRPPKCTVLWKELLRLKKQRGSSSLSLSSSSSSTSSSSSSMADVAATTDDGNPREMYLQRIRKGMEKNRSGSMRIRPIVSVPVCTTTHVRTNSNGGGGGGRGGGFSPMFLIRKGRSA